MKAVVIAHGGVDAEIKSALVLSYELKFSVSGLVLISLWRLALELVYPASI